MIKKIISLLLTSLFIPSLHAKPIIVAVIDTGIISGVEGLCKQGHKYFTGYGLKDVNGHGTNVSGLIHQEAWGSEYCQVIMKYFHQNRKDYDPILATIKAIQYAINLKVDVINYSSSDGLGSAFESNMFKKALDAGIKIMVPSGNHREYLGSMCTVFPACYDNRLTVIGRTDNNTSGYGPMVDFYENCTNREAYGFIMSGTSQATAAHTGKVIKELDRSRKR